MFVSLEKVGRCGEAGKGGCAGTAHPARIASAGDSNADACEDADFVILAVNAVDVKSALQFEDLVTKHDAKRALALLVQRGEQKRYLTLRIESK